jgi:hypothetical protein
MNFLHQLGTELALRAAVCPAKLSNQLGTELALRAAVCPAKISI